MQVNFKALLCCGLLLTSTMSMAQQMAKGTDFIVQNKNGLMDKREKGVAGVSVSNGREVVLTNSKGQYQLPVGNDNIIFVIKPSGYSLPLDKYNIPKSFYIHKPLGSPKDLKYAGVAPTGKLPAAVNFALNNSNEPDKFRALVFGDPQPYTETELAYFNRAIIDEVTGIKNTAFGICLGDLVGDNLDLHPGYRDATARIGLPWYNVIGNHDMNYDAAADSLSDENFEANFGPANYAFNYGKVHVIVLDDIRYPNPRGGKGYLGGFRKDQLDFIENDLKLVPKDRLIVLAFHIPLFHIDGDRFRPEDRQRLFELLKEYPNTLSLSAHTHVQEQLFYTRADGWQQDKPHHEYNVGTTCGDWWSGRPNEQGLPLSTMRDGTPQGYAFIDFDKNTYKLSYKTAGKSADYQIKLVHPKVVSAGKAGGSGIYANFFIGHEGNRVEYSIDGGKWKQMAYTKSLDPAYLAELYPFDNLDTLMTGRRPSEAVESSHLWRVGLPANLSIGTHTIDVRASDDFGNTYTAKSSYRIEPAKMIPLPAKR